MRDDAERPWLSAYGPDVPADIEPPRHNLPEVLDEAVRRFGDRPALEFFGSVTTYRHLSDLVERGAQVLHRLGVRKGDRVALVLPNCPQHVVAFYSALRVGAVVIEHNPLYTPEELQVQFDDHKARVAVCWSNVASTVIDLGVETVFSVDLAAAMPWRSRLALKLPLAKARAGRAKLGPAVVPGTRSWDDEVRAATPLPGDIPGPEVSDIALLQYTGGTTGTPKGAILTHANLAANAAQGRAWMPALRDGEETVLAALPIFHAYGLTFCLTFAVLLGAQVVLLPRFDVDQALDVIRRIRPTFLPGVPPIYQRLAAGARERGIDLTCVRFGFSGAMSLPPDVVSEWEELSGGLLIEGYGLSEASPVALGNPGSTGRRAGTVGVPFPSTRMRVVDPEHPDHDVPAGSPGELLVAGPQVFSGYWGRPEETAATLLPGGWLRTGDVVVVDDDGYVRIVDRIKELVITGGFNVYPSEVEEILRKHPDIKDVSVVGIPRSDGGEEVVAAVMVHEGVTIDAQELRRFCRSHLAGYKVPVRMVQVDDLPRTIIGKVLRRELVKILTEDGR
ncbi:MAG: long-chain acyl-CoA synthetase [Actinomycetota bacterium]|nr:long-chain acyl-CoA synthetase [Actinomycetota bacterium]